ncbi:MAG: arginine--tRNA ligase [Erysipelotrichaceae bacterium]|nr:arginine--tRNA ligase [Erysipelotrichaceae bacterium]
MNIEEKLVSSITKIVKEKYEIEPQDGMIMVEIPKDNSNGDYSTNIAMRLTKLLKRRPQEIAQEIKEELLASVKDIDSIDIAGPGFINFWMKKDAMAYVINTIIDAGDDYGHSDAGKGLKVLEEYVSANPTGPLHCGHARGACWGDSCVRIMNAAGYDATREYYINDAGAQILNLGKSLLGRYRELFGLDFTLPEDGYHGPDVIEIAKEVKETYGDKYLKMSEEEAVHELKELGKKLELDRIKKDLKYYGCEFDSWISEQWIVEQGLVDKAVEKMNEMGLLYEKDGAIWFKATEYGDDKDRVLKKSDGYYTYMTPDIANHIYKYDRGYELLVNIWGADHHGYIPRMKAAMEALGYPRDNLQVDICQMVRMVENGQEVKMSKRTGNAITLRELCDDIGVDCARYFFLSKALDTHLEFDLTLARTKSNDNPVYYAQYAYARICSVLRQAEVPFHKQESYQLLNHPKEIDLLKHINSFTDVVAEAAATRSPNKICNYIQKLATYFHSFYGACKINDKNNPELTNERLCLSEATRITLKNALNLIGVSAPEVMAKEDIEE